jgi:uncharacterized tellurite resistance protein B-like protein
MGVIGVVLAVVALVGAWWWRIQAAKDGAQRIADAAMTAKGAYSRHRFKTKAGESILAGVKEPGTAAAVLMYGLALLKGPVGRDEEEHIEKLLETVCRMNPRDRTEAMAFASWAAGHVQDPGEIMRRFMPLWMDGLEERERQELIGMCQEVAQYEGPATDAQRHFVRRLSEALLPK